MTTRHEKILLIVTYCINQEVEDAEQFVDFLYDLLKYDDDDLNKQIKVLQNASTSV